jgi:DNA-binding CsgD family transcriptional regulator
MACDGPTSGGAGPSAVLTRRQLDIARLVAGDLSNKQIAARLFLSERTIETHITNILNKLGLNSRTQISRWVACLDGPGLTAAEERSEPSQFAPEHGLGARSLACKPVRRPWPAPAPPWANQPFADLSVAR